MFGKHLIGLYEKALDPADSWEVRLKKAASLGADYIEICIDEQDVRIERLFWADSKLRELRAQCDDAGILIQSMCLSAHRRFPFGSANAATRKHAYEIMERAILFSEKMGIRTIQLAGYDVYYEPSTEESRRAFLEGLCWAARQAESRQVMLAIEIMDTDYINSLEKYIEFERVVQSPWLRVYPDMGNLSAWGNDMERQWELAFGRAVSVHVKDTLAVTESFPGQFKCVSFGEGCVDFAGNFGILERLGYAGPYTIEMWYQPGTDDVSVVREAIAYLEREYQRGCGSEVRI